MNFNLSFFLLVATTATLSTNNSVDAFIMPVPASLSSSTTATASAASSTSRGQRQQLHMITLERQNDGDEDDDDDEEDGNNDKEESSNDIDMSESLMSTSSSPSSGGASSSSIRVYINEWKKELGNTSGRPPLTSASRARLEKEIDLLQQISYDSYTACQEIEKLWRTSRGGQSYQALEIAESMMIRDGGSLLLDIINDEGLYWLEPLHSLANLLEMQGRFNDSKDIYEMILQHKPWHFNAAKGLNKCNKSLGLRATQDELDVNSTGPSMENQQWSNKMVEVAKSYLQQSEYGLQSFFNDGYNSRDSNIILGDDAMTDSTAATAETANEFADAWQ